MKYPKKPRDPRITREADVPFFLVFNSEGG